MRPLVASVTALLVLLPVAAASADEPDSAADAVDVPFGGRAGTLGPDDGADWIRLVPPVGWGVEVSVDISVPGYYVLAIRSDSGEDLTTTPLGFVGGGPASATVRAFGAGAVRVGLYSSFQPAPEATYSLVSEAARVADHAVLSFEVRNVPALVTDNGAVFTGMDRELTATFGNIGSAATWAWMSFAACTPSDGRCVDIATVVRDPLAPGEQVTFRHRWSPAMAVGDVTFAATVAGGLDGNPANDARFIDHFVLAGGTGRGVMLAPRGPGDDACAFDPVFTGCARAGVDAGSATWVAVDADAGVAQTRVTAYSPAESPGASWSSAWAQTPLAPVGGAVALDSLRTSYVCVGGVCTEPFAFLP